MPHHAKKLILVVCTGNTCRSPMAEGWLRAELKRHGLERAYEVISCGIFARRGAHASFEAELVLKNEDLDLSSFRSQPITPEIARRAEKILVMSSEHEEAIVRLVPEAADKIRVLDVGDPIGRDMHVYKHCFDAIKKGIEENWKWLVS